MPSPPTTRFGFVKPIGTDIPYTSMVTDTAGNWDRAESLGALLTDVPGLALFNMADHGVLGDGSNEGAAMQTALNLVKPGQRVLWPQRGSAYTVYGTDRPLKVPGGVLYEGASGGTASNTGSNTALGVTLKVVGGSAATWAAYGVLTSQDYDSGVSSAPGDPVFIRNLRIDGASAAVGNGVVLSNKQSRLENVNIENVNGDQAWDAAAAQGHGYGVVLAGLKRTAGILTASAPECAVLRCRLGSKRSRLFTTSTTQAGVSAFTDGFLIDTVLLEYKEGSTYFAYDDVDIADGGGWLVRGSHWNHSGGRSLRFRGALNTRVLGNYFDSWGHVSDGSQYECIYLQFSNGTGGSDAVVADNSVRYKATQQSGTFIFLRATAASASTLNNLAVSGNAGYVEAGAAGTQGFAKLAGNGSAVLHATVTGNNFDGITDANTFLNPGGTDFTSLVTCDSEGNWFNFGTAAPTTGLWAGGTKRWRRAITVDGSGTHLGDVCTSSGVPGGAAASPGSWTEILGK